MPRVAKSSKRLRAVRPSPAPRTLAKIRLLLMDCDGVLSDGGLYYTQQGATLLRFDIKDGLGLVLARRAGLHVGVITGRPLTVLQSRLDDLGISHVLGSCPDKAQGVRELCARLAVRKDETLFIGDDLPDLAAFSEVGLKVAVADAALEVRKAADWVTAHAGGRGAVREVCTAVLVAQGNWFTTPESLQ